MGVVAAQLTAQVSVSGADKAKSELEGVGGVVNKVGGFLGNALKDAAVDGAKALVGIGVQSVQMAGDFEASMIKIKTSAGETGTLTSGNLKVVSDGILQLATQTGTSADDLAQSMYFIESAGDRGAKGLQVLKAAAEGAKLENVDTTQVTRALLAVMEGYHMPAEQATNAMNALVSATSHGGASLNELTSAMSQVLPTASSLHIPFEQVAAAIGVMTNKQTSARQAAQNLTHVLLGLEAPNAVAADAMTNVGLSAQKVRDALVNQGLPQALQMIEDHVGQKFPKDSVEYTSALKDILGGIVGFKLAAQLTGPSLKTMETSISQVSAAAKDGSGNILGWADTQNTFNVKMAEAKELVETLGIKLGMALLPVVEKVLTALLSATPILTNLINIVSQTITNFSDWIQKNHTVENSINAVKQAVSSVQSTFVSLQPILRQIGNFLITTFKPVWDQLVTTWRTQLIPAWNQFMEALRPAMPSLLIIGKLLGALIIGALIIFLKSLASTLIGLIQVFGYVVQAISFVSASWIRLLDQARPVWQAIYNGFKWLYDVLLGHSIIPDMINGIVNWFAQLPGRVMGWINSLVGQIGATLGNLGARAVSWGADMINGFANGVASAGGNLIAQAQNIASQVASILHFSKPDTGPLRDADQWMPDMMQLLADGMTQNLGKVKSAALNVSATIANPNSQSSFASSSAGGLGGLSVVPSSVSQGATPINITVQSAPVYLDGKALSQGMLGPLVNQIRAGTGTFNF